MKRENTFCPPTDAYELLRCEAAPAILQTCYHRRSSRSHYASYGIEYTVRWEVYAVTPLLELEHVTYAYHSKNGEVCALSDISFQIQKAEFVAVVGPSGCGKSTLLSLLQGCSHRRAALFYYTAQGKEKRTAQRNAKRRRRGSARIPVICCKRITYLNGGRFIRMSF